MLANSTSSNNSSPSTHFSIGILVCFIYKPSSIIFITFNITTILLLLPLCIFILHHGLQLWRQKKSSTSSVVTVSHSNIFTYHMVVMELIGVCGCVLSCCGFYREDFVLLSVALSLYAFTWYGETLFHILTCVERYLAVVHPITYLSLRNQRGIRIRNISIACAWFLSVSWIIVFTIVGTCDEVSFVNFGVLSISLTIISLCSLSVLCVLIRPGPGGRERVDQSKVRAFYTILAILGALVLKLAYDMVVVLLYHWHGITDCVALVFHYWFNVPSTLVLPLLFLHRAGKLVCCDKNIQ